MPRAAGDGRHYGVGIIGVQAPCCPSCGFQQDPKDWLPERLGEWGVPVSVQDRYVSVTTVLNATLSKDGLKHWARNIAIEGMLTLAQQRGWDWRDPGIDLEMVKGLLADFGLTDDHARDAKGVVGSSVHDVMEVAMTNLYNHLEQGGSYAEGLEQVLATGRGMAEGITDPDEKGYSTAVLNWIEEWQPWPYLVEQPMACHHLKVAGTLDLAWRATKDIDYQRKTPARGLVSWEFQIKEGDSVVTDLKTAKDFRESHFIQVAWYGGHMVPDDLGMGVRHMNVLRVNPDGTWEVAGVNPGEGPGKKRTEAWGPHHFEALRQVYKLLKGE